MKLNEILNEKVESQREEILSKLEANKEALQRAGTRFGVIKVLKKIFPGVDFKVFGYHAAAASWSPIKKRIAVHNNERIFSRKTVRNEWESFKNTLTDLLTHENIHKGQSERRDHLVVQANQNAPKLPAKEKRKMEQELMNLISLYDELTSAGMKEEAEKTHKKIEAFIKKAGKKGVAYHGTMRTYLQDRDEVAAYAEEAAGYMMRIARGFNPSADEETTKQNAIKALKASLAGKFNPTPRVIDRYIKAFGLRSKTTNQFVKQTVQYIQNS